VPLAEAGSILFSSVAPFLLPEMFTSAIRIAKRLTRVRTFA